MLESRVWMLPAVFAVLAASLPIQIVFADRRSEPYPGLFMPAFYGDSQSNGKVRLVTPDIRVDGRRASIGDVVGPGRPAIQREVLQGMFPVDKRAGQPSDVARRAVQDNLKRSLGGDPGELDVTWQRRRLSLANGTVAFDSVVSRYHVEFGDRR